MQPQFSLAFVYRPIAFGPITESSLAASTHTHTHTFSHPTRCVKLKSHLGARSYIHTFSRPTHLGVKLKSHLCVRSYLSRPHPDPKHGPCLTYQGFGMTLLPLQLDAAKLQFTGSTKGGLAASNFSPPRVACVSVIESTGESQPLDQRPNLNAHDGVLL